LEEIERILAKEREKEARLECVRNKRRVTIQRYIARHLKAEVTEKLILLVIFAISAIYTLFSLKCFTDTAACVPDYARTAIDCQNYLTVEYVMIIFIFGIFTSSLICETCYGRNSPPTLLKFLVLLGVIIYYFLLYNSSCKGFSAETNEGLCTIKTIFGVTGFLVVALTFIPLELVHLLQLYLEAYVLYAYLRPIKRPYYKKYMMCKC